MHAYLISEEDWLGGSLATERENWRKGGELRYRFEAEMREGVDRDHEMAVSSEE